MSELPWYQSGLRFKCTECGKCCTGQSGFVWVEEEEIQKMAVALNLSLQRFKMLYIRRRDQKMALVEKKVEDGQIQCVFLKNNKCQIYQSRPKQCRTFPWWKENLNSEESWKIAALSCEGIRDSAPLISFKTIDENLNL